MPLRPSANIWQFVTVRLPNLVDLNEQDLQGQDPDGGAEYIVSFDTTLVKNLLTEILSLTSCAIFRFQTCAFRYA